MSRKKLEGIEGIEDLGAEEAKLTKGGAPLIRPTGDLSIGSPGLDGEPYSGGSTTQVIIADVEDIDT